MMWLALVTVAWAQPAAAPVTFHHLHLSDGASQWISFYEGLFDQRDVERLTLWGIDALRTGNVLLLASPAKAQPVRGSSAIWHYGWGGASLGETYLAHNLREVAWDPPLPAHRFHLHVESVTPNAAAAWYRDRLGAHAEFATDVEGEVDRDLRRPRSLVRFGSVTLLFYKAELPLVSTRGKLVDHLAFAVPDLEMILAHVRTTDTPVLEPAHALGGATAAIIEGPDRLAIELVELDKQ
jgi:catechol 2,3-dioxygenase-like lactoylglutathione lyase family enzyme